MRIDVVTIFPDYLAPLGLSLIGRAREQGVLDVVVHDLRDFTHDRHRTVDDTPYGGGAGMVMRPEPWGEALDHLRGQGPVLNGGEVAVLAVVEAVARLLPGVVGNAESLVEESHEGGLLEYPVYTKPASWRGREVPEVLLSGHHGRVAAWRHAQRLARTAERRPDLLLGFQGDPPAVAD